MRWTFLTALLCVLARGLYTAFPVERIEAPPLETGLSGERRRRRRRSEEPYGLFPVEDWRQDFDLEYVEYFAAVLQIGTPPQRQSVIIDTGSSLTFVACTGCPNSHCNQHDDPNFVPDRSSTFQWEDCNTCRSGRKFTCNYSTKQCQFNLRYYDGAGANGRIFSDVLDMGWEQIRLQMGCAQDERGGVITDHADGMMGLAAETKSSLTFQIGEQLGHKSIGYCFQAATGRGTLIFGDFDPKPPGLTWTQMKAGKGEPNLYYKSITRSMWIGDTLVTDDHRLQDNPFKGSVWDSGSPHMWMPKWMYALTKKAFMESVPQQYEFHTAGSQHMCWKVDREVALLEFPDFSFGLPDGKKLVLHPLQYLITAKGAGGLLQCADIFDAGNNHEGLAFGSTNMLDMLIIFDYDNARMGFMHHDCECFLLEGGVDNGGCIAQGATGGIQSPALLVPTRSPNHGAPPVPQPVTQAGDPLDPMFHIDSGGPPLPSDNIDLPPLPSENFEPIDNFEPEPEEFPLDGPPAGYTPPAPPYPQQPGSPWVPSPSPPPQPEWVPHPENNPWDSRGGSTGTHDAFTGGGAPTLPTSAGGGLWEPKEGTFIEPAARGTAVAGPEGGTKVEAPAAPDAEAGFVDKIIEAVTNPGPDTKKVLTYVVPFVAGLCVGGIICLILRRCRKRGYKRVNTQSEAKAADETEIEDLLPGGVEMEATSLPVDSDDDHGVQGYDETARNLL